MRFLLLLSLIASLALYASALPSSRKGQVPFRQSSRAIGYLVAKDSEASTGSFLNTFYRSGPTKEETRRVKLDALLSCQEECTRIWNPAHPSQFWTDCNECCRKIGDAVAYC